MASDDDFLTKMRKNVKNLLINNLILLGFLPRGSMTVPDQGSFPPFLAHTLPSLITLVSSPLMIKANPQQFQRGRVCAFPGRQPQGSVSP
jgi:hypothetical protein